MGSGLTGLDKASPSGIRKLIAALLVAANFFVILLSVYSAYESRRQHTARAQILTQNMAQAVNYSLSNSIEKIDFALKAVADELQHELAERNTLDPERLGPMLDTFQKRLPEVEAFRVSDERGLVIFGKGVDPNEKASWADREYFAPLRDHPDAGLHVSKPRLGRVAKKYIVGFERRYNRPDGSFGGIVAAPIALDHFQRLLSQFELPGKATLVLRDADLGLIVRHPAVEGPAGATGSVMVSDRFNELIQSGATSATYDAVLAIDGREWKITYQRISAAPMIVLAGISADEYLAAWYAQTWNTALIAVGLLLLSVVSGWAVFRSQKHIDRESARNRLYLHHAADGIHILDGEGNLLQASDQFCRMLGYNRDEVIGMNLAQWEAGWPAAAVKEQILPEWLALSAAAVFDTVHRRKDGRLIDVEVHVAGFDMEGKRCLFASSRDIGEEKRHQLALVDSENRLRQSEERYRLMLENSPVGVLHYDPNLIVTYANDRFSEIMQVPKGYMLGLDCNRLQDQSVAPPMRQSIAGKVTHYEGPYVTSYGRLPLWISMHCGPVRNAKGDILGGLVILEDITERKRIEEVQRQQREEQALAASVFIHAHEGIIICDANQVILDVNPTFSEITGYERDEIIGKTPKFLSSGKQDAEFYKAMWQAIREQGHWQGEVWNRRKDGTSYAERLTISRVVNDQNQVTHYIGTFSDISLLKLHQAELERMAHYDPLTHLPNRALLSDRMGQALAQARRNGNLVAVCYLDLDGFKAINDELGHEAGDTVLIEVARRLKDMVRASDTVARLGGDEFVVLLIDVEGRSECDQVAARILRSIAASIRIGDYDRCVSGSLGIALYPHDAGDADTLLRLADHAMYTAKQSGKNRHLFFDSTTDHLALARQEAETRLQQAMESNELCLYYQPIVDMRDGRVVRLEGLIRWNHPDRGLLLPDEFLPAVTGTALDKALGRWVLAEGLQQLSEWRRLGLMPGLSLNISSTCLLSPDFCSNLAGLLGAYPMVDPHALELEIMESAATVDMEAAIAAFNRCHDLGVTIALDDFGSGHSSLSYFRRLPVDTLKIDQAFVHSVLGDAEDLAVVDSVVRLTQAFNRKLVAEGVESVEIGMLLLNLGCSIGQGFSIARPMPPGEVPAWIASFTPDRNWTLPMSEISRADMPLFMAELEHRAWVRQMGAWLDADPDVPLPPALDHHTCRFGKWYDGPGRQRYEHLPSFAAIGEIHEAIHRHGLELVRLREEGRTEEGRRLFEQMTALRDQLVEQLASMQGKAILENA